MNILLVIDVQNDFCEGGALACPGGKDIVPRINALMETGGYDLIIASQDWHPENHISFASEHGVEPFTVLKRPGNGGDVTVWPKHCVAGEIGARFYDGVFNMGPSGGVMNLDTGEYKDRNAHIVPLNANKIDMVVRKGTDPDVDSYSLIADGNGQDNAMSWFLEGLFASDPDDLKIDIAGIATDVCVLATVKDIMELPAHLNCRLSILTDVCVGTTEEKHNKALQEMKEMGASLQ